MKKGVLLLWVSLFLISTESTMVDFSAIKKELAAKKSNDVRSEEMYEELREACQGDESDKIIGFQPERESKDQRKGCVLVTKCADLCCERYFKMTWVACSLFMLRDGIALGIL